MSMDRCSRCGRLVDTDDDTEFYDAGDKGLCEHCREDDWKEQAEDERLDDPRHGQADSINRG